MSKNYSQIQEISAELKEIELSTKESESVKYKNDKNENQDKELRKISDGHLFRKDLGNILLLCVLYFYQGLIASFFLEYVMNFLIQEKKISGEKIASLKSILWPFSFKFLWAPIMDTYYLKSFGRRKTYLIPAQLLVSLIMFISAFYINDWMEQENVIFITSTGMFCIFLLTIQDIAVDSWSVSLLHEKNVAYSSFSESFGQRVGNIIGYQLFIYWSDTDLIEKIFGSSSYAINTFDMCILISVLILIGTLFILFFRKDSSSRNEKNSSQNNLIQQESINIEKDNALQEKDQEEEVEEEDESFSGMINKIKSFFKNKDILFLIVFLLTSAIGNYCVDVPASIMLLSKGFNRQILATIDLCLIPLTQIISAFAARLASKKQEFYVWIWCLTFKSFLNLGTYYIVENFQEGQTSKYTIHLIILSTLDSILCTMPFITTSAFILRACYQSTGGTYITLLNSFFNFGQLWPQLVVSAMSSHISLFQFLIIGSGFNLMIFFFWRKKVILMQTQGKDLWKIKNQ